MTKHFPYNAMGIFFIITMLGRWMNDRTICVMCLVVTAVRPMLWSLNRHSRHQRDDMEELIIRPDSVINIDKLMIIAIKNKLTLFYLIPDVSVKPHKVVETGRQRNKNMGPLIAAAAMKFGLLGALTFKGLTLMVGKALLISKIALLLATIIGLKKLFSREVD